MTSKMKLAEQVQRMLSGGTPSRDTEVSIQELIVAVSQMFAQAVKLNLYGNKREGESDVDGAFIYTFDCVPVKKDDKKNLYYSILPSPTIALPNDASISMVSLMQDQENAFIRVPNNFLQATRGLPTATLENQMGFWRENSRIYYTNMAASDEITEVLLKLVAGVDGIGDDDLIDIPLDIQADIVQRVFQMYAIQQQAPKDELNNSNKQ